MKVKSIYYDSNYNMGSVIQLKLRGDSSIISHHSLILSPINYCSMEPLKHECGVAMVRLLKPLEYYQKKYGTWMWGVNILYLLMEKQHNRGQEGAGLACVKLHAQPGEEFIFRERALGTGAITEIFQQVHKQIEDIDDSQLLDRTFDRQPLPFA